MLTRHILMLLQVVIPWLSFLLLPILAGTFSLKFEVRSEPWLPPTQAYNFLLLSPRGLWEKEKKVFFSLAKRKEFVGRWFIFCHADTRLKASQESLVTLVTYEIQLIESMASTPISDFLFDFGLVDCNEFII